MRTRTHCFFSPAIHVRGECVRPADLTQPVIFSGMLIRARSQAWRS